ncbi:hypothetical protein [Occallatibacter savannae]|uniref:hypothetical protein n=1 Tax=Occallatibacter savannae TaxID=1002691 RepID=UPI0013A5B741|nr:hypothetical protein [Occallatibacter savannae]
MRSTNCKLASMLVALVLALITVPGALAQCGFSKNYKPASWQPSIGTAHLARTAFDDGDADDASIVGMWHVIFTAKTVNGNPISDMVIDNALTVWHSDHTEIMNSVRPPQDGNFCLGVWKRTGTSSYYLNHFAWFANQFPNNTNNGIGAPVGPARFTEKVTVSPDGQHFTGTFTLTAYDTGGNVMVAFTGALSGTRITTSTTTSDLLQ